METVIAVIVAGIIILGVVFRKKKEKQPIESNTSDNQPKPQPEPEH